MTSFFKMHGLGNDFAVFDARKATLTLEPSLARAIADRRRGIGCDQILVLETVSSADAYMRVFNADGGTAELSGNGARCAARVLAADLGRAEIRFATKSGPVVCTVDGASVQVDMGPPRLDWREIPMAQAVDTQNFALPVEGFSEPALGTAAALSMGNPHCVLFVADAETAPVAALGPVIENHAWFPARTNVEFVSVLAPGRLRMRVWERGAGVTEACGTGACAAAVAAGLRGLAGRHVALVLDGGTLAIDWREADDHVLMTGPAVTSFTGDIDLAALAREARA